MREASTALSIPANLNLLGYELAEKFAASAEYCEPLEMNSESRAETEMTPHPLAILPTNTVVQVSEELQFCLVYLFVWCRASPAAVPERSFFLVTSSGCFSCRLLGAGFCLRDGNVKHLIRVLSEPNHGLEKHHWTLVSSSDSLIQALNLEMGPGWRVLESTLGYKHISILQETLIQDFVGCHPRSIK